MYTFIIKNNKKDVEIALTRAMLAMSAVAAIAYPNNGYFYLSLGLSAVLIVFAAFTKLISTKINGGKWMMLLAAAGILFFTSGQVWLPMVLFVYGAILKFLVVDPVITVNEQGVTVKRNYITRAYPWAVFNNVILKDGLLSLDFTNNKVRYFMLTQDVDEGAFNAFCNKLLAVGR